MFHDRRDAGERLATRLTGYRDVRPQVLALPRGGVPVAVPVARALAAPLDLLLVRKIGVPWHPELAMGAVVDGARPQVVWNPTVMTQAALTSAEREPLVARELAELERRRQVYRGARTPPAIGGRTVIVVDDGIATGTTMRAALEALRRQMPAALVLAVPVAAAEALALLRPLVDDVVCLETPRDFLGVSQVYDSFPQLTDAEVTALLAAFG